MGDNYFCLALDEHSGQPRISARAAGTGCAAALLSELLLSGFITLEPDGIRALSWNLPTHDLQRQVHALMLSQPHHRDPKLWLEYLSRQAWDDIAARLSDDALIEPVLKRRLGRSRVVHQPLNHNAIIQPSVRIANALSDQSISTSDLTCVALARATGLLHHLLWDDHTHGLARLSVLPLLARLPPPLTALADLTETLVAESVLTSRA